MKDKLRDTQIIIGGPDVRYNAENLLNYGADYLVIGEGEQSALEIIQVLESDLEQDIGNIAGIAFKDRTGKIIVNAEREKIKNIDILPFPNRNKINLKEYLSTWKTHHGQSALSVSTMRGCPYTCKWCSRAVYGLSYRRRSPEKVVDELLFLKENYSPDTIWFVDDVFTVSHKWLEAFTVEVKKRNARIPYECITRADRMNDQVITLLKESGCFRVWIGAESGSQHVIDLMDRRVKVEKVREMIQSTREKGIQTGTFIMLGYPGEKEKDIEETILHLKSANPDYFTITLAYPIRGTELFEEIEAIQSNYPDWVDSTDRDIDFRRSYPRKYYDWAIRRVVNEVNFHKELQKRNRWGISGLTFKSKALIARLGMWWVRKFSYISA